MVSLIGNAAQTLGGTGIYGPFNKNLSWSVPAYGCFTGGVKVLKLVPSELAGKIASVMFSLIDTHGCVIKSAGCLVQVTP